MKEKKLGGIHTLAMIYAQINSLTASVMKDFIILDIDGHEGDLIYSFRCSFIATMGDQIHQSIKANKGITKEQALELREKLIEVFTAAIDGKPISMDGGKQ